MLRAVQLSKVQKCLRFVHIVVVWDGRLGGHGERRPSPEFYILFILLTILGLVRSAEYSPLGPDLQMTQGSCSTC